MDHSGFLEILRDQARLLEFVRNEHFLTALEKSARDPESQKAATLDIGSFLNANAVTLPEGANAQFKTEGWGICINLGPVSICYSK